MKSAIHEFVHGTDKRLNIVPSAGKFASTCACARMHTARGLMTQKTDEPYSSALSVLSSLFSFSSMFRHYLSLAMANSKFRVE